MESVRDISETLKAARKAKELSQRALAERAGVPQSHISKIETTGVDLRISSLIEIARALDLELTLVPRKSMPAINSIVRSVQQVPLRQADSIAKELAKLQERTNKIVRESALKEAAQLQSRVRELTKIKIPLSSLDTIKNLNKRIQALTKEPESLDVFSELLDQVQKLRNQLAHSHSEAAEKTGRSVYSLDEDNHG